MSGKISARFVGPHHCLVAPFPAIHPSLICINRFQVLEGDRLVSTPFKLPFKANITEEKLCTKKLSPKDVQRFRTAVANNYYFQLYYDDLPLWGFFGKVEKFLAPRREEYKYYLFTHFHFHIGYNNDRVIEINAQVDPLKAIDITSDEDVEATFTYSATWRPTSIPFERRLEKYSRHRCAIGPHALCQSSEVGFRVESYGCLPSFAVFSRSTWRCTGSVFSIRASPCSS